MKARIISAGFELPKPAKRTPIDAHNAEKFIGEGSPANDAETPRKKSKARVKATTVTKSRKKRGELGERMTIYVPPELAEAVRVKCAKTRTSLSLAGTEALERWVDK